jgi:hypothetical protein
MLRQKNLRQIADFKVISAEAGEVSLWYNMTK